MKKVLIIGNKQYHNFKLDDILDTFDVIYRFNLAWPNKNNGTKFGKLAMCGHIYHNFIANPVSKEQIIEIYKDEYDIAYLGDWYDFFQENKENFDEIFHQNEHNWAQWNQMLEEYGSPHRFPKMTTTGYSTIFRNLSNPENEIYVSCFTLCDNETRESIGDSDGIVALRNQAGCHSASDETSILAWLHNSKKVDASLCMLDDTQEVSINTNGGNTEPSEFILGLIKNKQ